jgi:hypothetical protein
MSAGQWIMANIANCQVLIGADGTRAVPSKMRPPLGRGDGRDLDWRQHGTPRDGTLDHPTVRKPSLRHWAMGRRASQVPSVVVAPPRPARPLRTMP